MARQDLPTDKEQAIEFAKSEFAKRTRFWPRLLVRCMEVRRVGNALAVVHRIYARRCGEEPNIAIESWLHELHVSRDIVPRIEVNFFRNRSFEIWNDPRCRSSLCRGVTRLFNSMASFAEHDFDAYEIELTRAIGMLTISGDMDADKHEFSLILQVVQEEFEK